MLNVDTYEQLANRLEDQLLTNLSTKVNVLYHHIMDHAIHCDLRAQRKMTKIKPCSNPVAVQNNSTSS